MTATTRTLRNLTAVLTAALLAAALSALPAQAVSTASIEDVAHEDNAIRVREGRYPLRFNTGTTAQRAAEDAARTGVLHPPGGENFADVTPSSSGSFYDAIVWASNEGITEGYNGGTQFRPTAPVTRMAMAAFMHWFVGSSPGEFTSEFSDVSTSHPFYHEISFM